MHLYLYVRRLKMLVSMWKIGPCGTAARTSKRSNWKIKYINQFWTVWKTSPCTMSKIFINKRQEIRFVIHLEKNKIDRRKYQIWKMWCRPITYKRIPKHSVLPPPLWIIISANSDIQDTLLKIMIGMQIANTKIFRNSNFNFEKFSG